MYRQSCKKRVELCAALTRTYAKKRVVLSTPQGTVIDTEPVERGSPYAAMALGRWLGEIDHNSSAHRSQDRPAPRV